MTPHLIKLATMTRLLAGMAKEAISARFVANAYARASNARAQGLPGAPSLARLNQFADKAQNWLTGANRRALALYDRLPANMESVMKPETPWAAINRPHVTSLDNPLSGRIVDPALHKRVAASLRFGSQLPPPAAHETARGGTVWTGVDGIPRVTSSPRLGTYLHEMAHAGRFQEDRALMKRIQQRAGRGSYQRENVLREYLANRALRERHPAVTQALAGSGLQAPTIAELQAERRPGYESYHTYALGNALHEDSLSRPEGALTYDPSYRPDPQDYPPFLRRMLQARQRANATVAPPTLPMLPTPLPVAKTADFPIPTASPVDLLDSQTANKNTEADGGTGVQRTSGLGRAGRPIDNPTPGYSPPDAPYQDSSSLGAQGNTSRPSVTSAGASVNMAMSAPPVAKSAAFLARIQGRAA